MKSSLVLAFAICLASASAAPPKNALATNPRTINCVLCKTFMGQVNEALTKPENEEAIANAIKEVCGIVYPNNEDGKLRCEVMIEQYTPSIIELFVNSYLEPETFCTQLTMCP